VEGAAMPVAVEVDKDYAERVLDGLATSIS
jgi:hypothetical protein